MRLYRSIRLEEFTTALDQPTLTPADSDVVERPPRLGRWSFLAGSPIVEALQLRDFRWMCMGSFASFLAMNMQMLTRGWLVLRLADDSPLALSLAMMSFAAPMTVVSIIGGALADRISRKQMVIISQSGNVCMALLIATLDVTGVVTFWHVMVIGLFDGSLMALNMPSRQALISELVPENRLLNAISLNNSAMNLTRVVGPAMAGVLIIYVGTAGVFYLVAGSYFVSAASTAMVRAGAAPASRSRKGITGDIGEGFAYAARNPVLLGLVIMTLIPSLFGFTYFALLPAWGREALNVASDDLGVLLMLMGIGALVGTLALASLRSMKRRGVFLLVSCLLWGVTLALFSQTTSYAWALPMLMFMGLVSSVFMSLNMTLLQLHAAPEMRGRVMSIAMMTWGLMPLGALPFGAIAESIGTPDSLMISGLMLAGFTVVFSVGYPRFRRIA